MISSYNRPQQKARSAQISKKNSLAASALYKQVGQALKDYRQNKGNGQTRRDRTTRNSTNNILQRQPIQKPSTQHSKSKVNPKPQQKNEITRNNSTTSNKKTSHNLPIQQKQNHPIVSIFKSKQNNKNFINLNQQDFNQHKICQKTYKKSFQYKFIIGKGGFGKVWKVEHIKTRNQYALKQMLKSLVMSRKSVQSVINQRLLLSNLHSTFIVNMQYAFQDRDTLYLVLDLLEGGDLRHHINTRRFSQIQSKFFVSCIILGLQYLHNNRIIHRDIKPQNLVLDARGYVRITDLGIARIHKTNNSCDTSGTPGYMSPEVLCRMNHSFVSDFYALGIVTYQLATGKRPYNGISRNQIRQQVLSKQAFLKYHDLPNDWSLECIDFINKLLQRKPQQRLGYISGIDQLKNHPWIKDINWKKLANRDIQSPFIPLMKKTDFDQDQQITIEDEQQAELIQKNSLLLRKPEFQQLFKQYYFQPNNIQLHEKEKLQTSEFHPTMKMGGLGNARRKSNNGLHHQGGLITVKNSFANLKKTNVSTNNSTQITNTNTSGVIKPSGKITEISSHPINGAARKKSNPTVRQSKQNIINVTEVSTLASKSKERAKDK